MKKASIAIALVLVFGLVAGALSQVPAVAQNATIGTNGTGMNVTSSNATAVTDTTNATTAETTANVTGGETFSAKGSIATLIFDTGETITTGEVENDTATTTTGNLTTSGNETTTMLPQIITGGEDNATTGLSNMTGIDNQTATDTTTQEPTTTVPEDVSLPYVLAGDWNLDVQDGSVSDFAASFVMVHLDGTERHRHEFSNFISSNSSTFDISGEGTSFIFGTVDVATDGQQRWTGVDALIIIERNNVISISLATEDSDDHFMGQPIYGIVESMTDESGNELIDTGLTTTVGNETGGVTDGNMTTTGNQTGTGTNQTGTGGFIDNLTSGVKSLFNTTGQ
ncbi:MAG TPA: hypothetical protein VNI77_00605 [Nitrososphaera sp.]|nr:hypothetical protein [Nitrososphaera sp.]